MSKKSSTPNLDKLLDQFPDAELLCLYPKPDFDHCIAGVVERYGFDGPVLACDYAKIISTYMSRDNMSADEVEEFFQFNTIGAWMGEKTPCFFTPLTPVVDVVNCVRERRKSK